MENVAYGHVCAEKTLSSEDGAKRAAGKVWSLLCISLFNNQESIILLFFICFQTYFITNMEAIKFWEFMSLILEGLGYERY